MDIHFYNYIVYCYLYFNQKWAILTNNLKVYIQLTELLIIKDNIVQSLFFRYMLYKMITKLVNFFESIRNKLDVQFKEIQLKKNTSDGEKTIIIKSDLSLADVSKLLDNIIPTNDMMNIQLLNCELCSDKNTEPLEHLEHLFIKYHDPELKFNHTIRYIFMFNNLSYNTDSYINLRLFRNKKIISKKILINDVLDTHINLILSD